MYGYLLVGTTTGRLWAAERGEGGPFRVEHPGDEILVRPTLRLRSEAP